MSKLEELIQKYCPDGVEWKKISEIADTFIGLATSVTKYKVPAGVLLLHNSDIKEGRIELKSIEYLDPFFVQRNSSKILHTDDVITVHTGDVGTSAVIQPEYDGTIGFTTISSRIKNKDIITPAFLCRVLNSSICKEAIASKTISDRSNLNLSSFDELLIPLPPLPVQEEIVRVSDTFTELQTELQAELQKREQQYEYYQDLLLNKSQFSHLVSIGDMCEIKKGNTPIQKAKEGVYPLVVTTMERRSSDTYQFNANAVCIPLISSRGHGVASLNHVYYQEGKFALGNILCAVIPHDEKVLKAKFLYYYLEYAKDYTLVPLMKGGANVSMHCSDIEKVKIPLPSLDEQERIISILDKFDTLTRDLTSGLPAEIEKRRQQFDYYRDKLLTFKRKEA